MRYIPVCTAPGCVEPAAGTVTLQYVSPLTRHLCDRHMHPIRMALLAVLREPPAESPTPAAHQPAAEEAAAS